MTEKRRRVLLVEDEPLVAMLIEDMLVDLGHEIVGPAMRIRAALPLAESEEIDFAILDVNVHGETSFEVAAILKRRDIPFIFATGYGKKGLNEEFADHPTLTKPFDAHRLTKMLSEIEG